MTYRLLAFLLILPGLFTAARGHQVDSVDLEFHRTAETWELVGQMDIAYMLPETRGVADAPPLYRNDVVAAAPVEWARIRQETENTLRKLLEFEFDGKSLAWRVEFPEIEAAPPLDLPEETGGWALLTTRIVMDPVGGAGTLRVHWKDDQETELIIVIEDSDEPEIISVPSGSSGVLMEVGGDGTTRTGRSGVSPAWIGFGFRHVIPLGLDHLLFILGLFLLAPRWKPLLGQSLLFTLAHSITLTLAVFGLLGPPDRPVEILIAASIAWIGIENLLTRELKPRRLVLVFVFGLLHGFGFASILAEKLGSLPPGRLTLPLIGFNLGVELAQLTVLAVAFAILWPLKKWTRQIQVVGSVVIALAGIGWVVERVLS